jgi:molybdenum cofactor synthesis domain-containing protein
MSHIIYVHIIHVSAQAACGVVSVLNSSYVTCVRAGDSEQQCLHFCAQADNKGCCLIVTTGGTGPSPRDVTPEATEAVCSRMLPGYGEQMRAISLKYVPTAVLSRQTAGGPFAGCSAVCR